ncbi:MAG: helix-turn-helix transcriptional regulator [Peptococcaceae bacterium]|jgi:transcriptional regulator with XRE-family HTH domain|nr:helix-turn-helix transcriptional regulator [Peptococcaceae bacterium]MBQ2015160.1 helix-turn-helix transcriptional regulator [Peptococcaceae bacterium]MBQ2119983.1 helix-turn-helix transcriptional regulator [Peptococcaceae bacterium]MBQ2449411.1 helix-turn-helix transcriptional regulator [Peptococcaceae bacterium]MBQ5858293.1 helix-turn-helix transcriptional regulator [Peptococcaceae bacterium]
MINLGNKLKTLRIQRQMTLKDVACRVGVSKSIVSAYENGSRRPSYEMLIKLARLFNVTTDYLLGLEQKKQLDLSGLTIAQQESLYNLVSVMRQPYEPVE